MSRGRFPIYMCQIKVDPSYYIKHTYFTVPNSIYQVDFPYSFMRPIVVFYHYPWNNQVFYYGTVHYINVLYRKEDRVIRKQNLSVRKHDSYTKSGLEGI